MHAIRVVEREGNCDFNIGFLANSYSFLHIHHVKSFKMRYIKSLYKLFQKCES
jgi:hypothetical protein